MTSPAEPAPASARAPWLRSGLGGLVVLLLPFAWVVDVDSCGHAPQSTNLTGFELAGHIEADVGWLVVVPLLLAFMAAPLFAPRLRPLARVGVHLLGVAAAVFFGWGMFLLLFFTIFSERTLRPAGALVAMATSGALVDAVARFVASVREWWRARRAHQTNGRRPSAGRAPT